MASARDREDRQRKFVAAITTGSSSAIRSVFTREKLEKYIAAIEEAKNNKCTKSAQTYSLLKRYDVAEILGTTRLVKVGVFDPYVYYVHVDEIFDTIDAAHRRLCHGGEKRTYKELKKQVANVTLDQVRTFIHLCVICEQKRAKREKRLRVVRPIVTDRFGARAQIDLIDMRSQKSVDGYQYIFHYQDHFSKYSILEPLKTKEAKEVGQKLQHIFCLFGAPDVLQSDNGCEFVADSIKKMMARYWPAVKLVHGRPRYPQSQGSVERANGDVENMLRSFMAENDSVSWADALKFVQFGKNTAHHRVIGMSPYKAVFGQEPRGTTANDDDDDDQDHDQVGQVWDVDGGSRVVA